LDHQLDRYHEYTEFMKIRAKFVKRRWRKRLCDNSGDGFFLNVEEYGNAFNDLMIRAQATLSRPIVSLGSTVDKWVFAVSVLSRMVARILFVTVGFIGLIELTHYLTSSPISFMNALNGVVWNKLYLAFLVATVAFSVRLILFRLREPDKVNVGRA